MTRLDKQPRIAQRDFSMSTPRKPASAKVGSCATTPIELPPLLPPSPCCCDTDPVAGLKQLFVDYYQGRGMAAGRNPATRPVFLRLHGAAYGKLTLDPSLPDNLKVGVFGQATSYDVWVRFSADLQPGLPDLKGTTGIAIKLFGVAGRKLLPPDEEALTQDFILQNHDVFFVDTAKDMCEFTCQSLHGEGDAYLKTHPVTAQILDDMEKVVDSALTTPYWSVLPSRFGSTRYIKYKLEPLDAAAPDAPPDFADPFYLRADLHSRLRNGPARFRFMVQFRTDDATMPLDAATVRWSETASPPVQLGILELPRQDLDARGQSTYAENLAYNPWHSLPEHEPVGSLSEARKVVYRASAANRRNVNGVPQGEPVVPRPADYAPGVPYPAAKDTTVVRAAIHPAIGIARVGNSEQDFFIGPQVIEPPPRAPGFYRDSRGALKREAAQFRVYGYNAAGEVVRELTSDWAEIGWTVHLANKKAAWYQWQIAMDIPEAATTVLPRRNPKVMARDTLIIDAGPRRISGNQAEPVLCAGEFTGVAVKLGELHTDDKGRLLVLGGHGVSASPNGAPIFNPADGNSFINADDWYDDTCDGTVTATVTIEGRAIPVESAWVVSAPPNYAPQIKGERSLYDLLYDLYVQAGWLPAPATISFVNDVYPILHRLSGLQWVNQGFATQFGHNGRFDFNSPALLERLATLPPPGSYDPNTELRRQIFTSFRPPQAADGNQLPWPWLYGDAMDVPAGNSPRQNASISQTQYDILQRWVDGDFVDDRASAPAPAQDIDAVPVAEQPAMLDRAALEFCLADAFHPGCEMTWPMRHLTLYDKPFRIRQRAADTPEPDYGATLDQSTALSAQGPLYAQGPGDINRWMGLPWQADTAFCRAGYDTAYDPFAPTFWPARVPNHVLTASDYEVVVNESQPLARRIEAFGNRTSWNKPLHGSTAAQMEQMVSHFGSMGLLEVRPGVTGNPVFPAIMMVASYGPDVAAADTTSLSSPATLAAAPASTPATSETRSLPHGANFASHEEARSAPLPVRHGKRPG